MGWWTRRLIPLVVGVVLILIGFVWHAQDEGPDGAEDAVRAYVALIAKGDASAANATVDPSQSDHIDPRLLTDKVLGAASKHIEVSEVTARPAQYPVVQPEGKMDVQVRYQLDGQQHKVTLVAQRDDGVLGFGRQWRVITPLTAPVIIGYNRPGAGQAKIGSIPIPADQRPPEGKTLHVYPGYYTITANPSTYFTANDHTLPLTVDSEDPLPQSSSSPEIVKLDYLPNEQLLLRDAGKPAIDLLHACLADSPDVTDNNCPYPTKSDATNLRLTAKPIVTIDDFPHFLEPGDITNPIPLVVEFPIAYTDSSGEPQSEKRSLYAMIHIDKHQTVRIDYEY